MTARADLVSHRESMPESRRRSALRRKEAIVGYLFILPALIGLILFYVLPTLRAAQISMTSWNLMRPAKWVGFENYTKLWADGQFWDSMWITLLYVMYNIPVQTALGLLIAVLADRLAKSVTFRAVIIAPYLISNVVAGLVWLLMLDPLIGVTNSFLGLIGIGPQAFLSSPDQSLVSVAAISIWRHVGFTALLFYAGLQSIPRDLYEAARLDGASEFAMFRLITLPLLRPVLVFVLVTSVVGSFQIFDVIAVTTQGGPADSTRAVLWYIYENAFKFSRMGYASAMSMVLFVLLILVTLLQMRLLRGDQSDLG
ncbi:carbohydrate ABC transporter permease [uncultured Paracoccus sp.]|uniref:carbohydrate ABC transporter permease n=1 Tax=uncultured Paracoccus sp. TaxID=189685 RepID=UPI0026324AAF|nr:sugar ABC transporter permease [uncultured Paracoccus sp.]